MAAASDRMAYGPHPEQYINVYRPAAAGARPVLAILVHGGFWKAKYSVDNALTREVARALAGIGWHVADIEYRRVGHTGGGWPGSNADVLAALGHIRAQLTGIVPAHTRAFRTVIFGCARALAGTRARGRTVSPARALVAYAAAVAPPRRAQAFRWGSARHLGGPPRGTRS